MHTRNRHLEIDLLRTIAVVMMVVYHAAFDLSFFYGLPFGAISGGWLILQRSTANLFLLLVGMSFAVSYGRMEAKGASRRNILMKYARRGLFVFLCGMLVTAVTFFVVPEAYVRFGVLHMIGVSILLLPFLMPLREGNLILAIAVYFLGRVTGTVPEGYGIFLPFGWMPAGFVSVDYFPLFPWMATILLGVAVGNALYNRGWLRWHVRDHRFWQIMTTPGRHALEIYLMHQPILFGLLWVYFQYVKAS
ncbi:MAG: heparan-alpha-glucosaminide N-acetyltransferase [Candidatus Peribacteraceae bacterium]|jgi:uncharacterized membrane protein